MPKHDAEAPDPEITGRFSPTHSDPETQRVSQKAFSEFVKLCSAKIKNGAWGTTVLIFDWREGQIVGAKTEETNPIKVDRKRPK